MAPGYSSYPGAHLQGMNQPSMHQLNQFARTVNAYPDRQMNIMAPGFAPAVANPIQGNQVQPISDQQYRQMGFAEQFPSMPDSQLSYSDPNNDEEYDQQDELYFQ
jgi:hypothetical protein